MHETASRWCPLRFSPCVVYSTWNGLSRCPPSCCDSSSSRSSWPGEAPPKLDNIDTAIRHNTQLSLSFRVLSERARTLENKAAFSPCGADTQRSLVQAQTACHWNA